MKSRLRVWNKEIKSILPDIILCYYTHRYIEVASNNLGYMHNSRKDMMRRKYTASRYIEQDMFFFGVK